MKLLKKSTIQRDLADQKKQQIDEGIQIARKVDDLRLKLADLEAKHAQFVAGMQTEMEKKTGHLAKEIKEREQEITFLDAQRLELIKPLTEEWNRVAERNAEIEQIKRDLYIVSSEMLQKEKRLETKIKTESETLNRIKVRERELIRVYDEVANNLQQIEQTKKDALNEKDKWDKFYEEEKSKLLEREEAINSYEFTLDKRKDQIETEEKEIADTKLQLSDQRQSLQKELERVLAKERQINKQII
jgi:chromosome segregation ATPase